MDYFLVKFLCFFVFFLTPCSFYNIDTSHPISFQGLENSYFGYSLSFHTIKNSLSVLVGSPKVNKVSNCPVSQNWNCQELFLFPTLKRGEELKWLGVNVNSYPAPESNYSLVCSHLMHLLANDMSVKGICFAFDNNGMEKATFSPFRRGIMRPYLRAQFGSSAFVSPDGQALFGAPGVETERGSSVLFRSPEEKGDVMPFTFSKPQAYAGESVNMGRVLGRNWTYITGAVRFEDFGAVFLSPSIKSQPIILKGAKPFSRFGHSTAVGDFNGDGYDDLAVSAPYYFEKNHHGAVYIYNNQAQGIKISDPLKITGKKLSDGQCSKGLCIETRFGFSLSCPGDLDKDGYDDLIIGAPFEDQGVIYVFSGSSSSIKTQYTQRIEASQVFKSSLPTAPSFGYTLSTRSEDVDSNGYPDILVGSFLNGKVFLLRTKPVANMEISFVVNPSTLNHKVPNCPEEGIDFCFTVKTCFKVLYEDKEKYLNSVEIDYRIKMDQVVEGVDRSSFSKDELQTTSNSTVIANCHKSSEAIPDCHSKTVYILSSNHDWLNPIGLSLSFNMTDRIKISPRQEGSLFSLWQNPILNHSIANQIFSQKVSFMRDCGSDNICQSDLILQVLNTENNIKVSDLFILQIKVTNREEEAHLAKLFVSLPPNSQFLGMDDIENFSHITCNPSSEMELLVVCDLGNPLDSRSEIQFGLKFDLKKTPISQTEVKFSGHLNTTSVELEPYNNNMTTKFQVISEADLSIQSQSKPSSFFYKAQSEKELKNVQEKLENMKENIIETNNKYRFPDQTGPLLTHVFEVKNSGKVSFSPVNLTIKWPFKYKKIYPILYIPDTSDIKSQTGICFHDSQLTNPYELQILTTPYNENNEVVYLKKRNQEGKGGEGEGQKRKRNRDKRFIFFSSSFKIDCSLEDMECLDITCPIPSLQPGESSVVKVTSRFWNETFQLAFPDWREANVVVESLIQVPPSILQTSRFNDNHKAQTLLIRDEKENQEVPWWVYLIAALIGLFLLFLLFLLLWKCGFFQRKTYDKQQQYSVTVTTKDQIEKETLTKKKNKK